MMLSPEELMERAGVVQTAYRRPEETPAQNGEPRRPRKQFNRSRLSDIMLMEFEPLKWAIEDYVAEGLSVLAGRQKLGKTWLALDWAIAVSTGGAAMGSVPVDQGDVLYIDLENGHRRIQRRLDTLFPNARNRPDLSRLEIVTESPSLDDGFIAELEAWRRSVALPKLVVIDVLQRIKPAGKLARNAYENDYSIMAELQQWATANGIAVVALHHTRKGGADDPLEALSGSNGLSACADATLVLDRDSNGTSLYVRGRDVEEKDTAIRFDGGMWSVLGDAADVRRSDERNLMLAALEEATEPLTPADIAFATGMKRNNVDRLLFKMGKANEVEKIGRGLYIHPRRTDLTGKNADTGKNGKTVRNEDETPAQQGARILTGSFGGKIAGKKGGTKLEPSPSDASPVMQGVEPPDNGTSYLRTDLTGGGKNAETEAEQGENLPQEVDGTEYDRRIGKLISGCATEAARIPLLQKRRKGEVVEDEAGRFWTRGRT